VFGDFLAVREETHTRTEALDSASERRGAREGVLRNLLPLLTEQSLGELVPVALRLPRAAEPAGTAPLAVPPSAF
jgi:hypothetical protein